MGIFINFLRECFEYMDKQYYKNNYHKCCCCRNKRNDIIRLYHNESNSSKLNGYKKSEIENDNGDFVYYTDICKSCENLYLND